MRSVEEEGKKKEKTDGPDKTLDPKSVIFIPFTPNSSLAKELREVEDYMEKLTGSRIKIVEKAGVQIKQVLVKGNPWAGTNCAREDCLICKTREETGIGKGMTCWKRNILYETWCASCKERDEKRAEEKGEDQNIQVYR